MLITYPNEWLSGNGKKHFKKGTGDVWAGNNLLNMQIRTSLKLVFSSKSNIPVL